MRVSLLLMVLLGTSGCAVSSWAYYEQAVQCHLRGGASDCDQHYQNAIHANSKAPGIHSSYATHLLLQGRTGEAEKEFAIEARNYPAFAVLAIQRIKEKNRAASAAGLAEDASPPATPGETFAPPSPTPTETPIVPAYEKPNEVPAVPGQKVVP